MSGHNKWSKIKRAKGERDAQIGNLFAKLAKEIYVAAKMGGGDPNGNSKLREVIAKARSHNMPNDNVSRAIKKATTDSSSANYESIVYEGYGPAGIAFIVETLTDNKNRTAGDVRSAFDKSGGSLGVSGSVSYLFERKGIASIDKEGITEEQLFETLIESPVLDITDEEDVFEVSTKPEDITEVLQTLENAKIKVVGSGVEQVPSSYINVPEEKRKAFEKLIDTLEEHDDVQNVFHNGEFGE
ncbi:MAG: YebC/PmpR family DNA-binding transcriptional regulator [Christensenellaceae bacterium]|jgi:YebC/PmpR family DNA-binding regulatory protein|nr:YebC/PmpR family DNA-binding transcriptional regulator [Christensenellaceae bacterium]